MRAFIARLVVLLSVISVLSAAGVLIAVSSGSWGAAEGDDGVKELIRVVAGAVAAIGIAFGVTLMTLKRDTLHVNDKVLALHTSIEEVKSTIRPKVDGVLKEREELQRWSQALRDRKTVFISGMSLRANTTEYSSSFEEVLKEGGNCKFLLIKPDSTSSAIVARNFLGHEDPSNYNEEIKRSIERLKRLQQQYPASIQIRVFDHVPAVSIALLDEGLPTGTAYIELYTLEGSSTRRPHLALEAQDSPIWYNYFASQLHKDWEKGEVW